MTTHTRTRGDHETAHDHHEHDTRHVDEFIRTEKINITKGAYGVLAFTLACAVIALVVAVVLPLWVRKNVNETIDQRMALAPAPTGEGGITEERVQELIAESTAANAQQLTALGERIDGLTNAFQTFATDVAAAATKAATPQPAAQPTPAPTATTEPPAAPATPPTQQPAQSTAPPPAQTPTLAPAITAPPATASASKPALPPELFRASFGDPLATGPCRMTFGTANANGTTNVHLFFANMTAGGKVLVYRPDTGLRNPAVWVPITALVEDERGAFWGMITLPVRTTGEKLILNYASVHPPRGPSDWGPISRSGYYHKNAAGDGLAVVIAPSKESAERSSMQ